MKTSTSSAVSPDSTADRDAAPRRFRSGWIHLCNGLDPIRDGGMVPSILGMTGALKRAGGDVQVVTSSPSRIDAGLVAEGLAINGPETDLAEAVGSAEVVHMHG